MYKMGMRFHIQPDADNELVAVTSFGLDGSVCLEDAFGKKYSFDAKKFSEAIQSGFLVKAS